MPQAAPTPPTRVEETLEFVLGFEYLDASDEHVRARFAVADRVKQSLGLVHGGAYAALAEGMCSAATFRAVAPDGKIAVGLSNHTSFLRPATQGTVHAAARRLHRGRTTWVWDVEFTDDDGRACALARVTLAVREAPPGTPREAPGDGVPRPA